MSKHHLLGDLHVVNGIPAVADAFAGTVYSDVINLKEWHNLLAIIHQGVGATGTATLTVEACDDAAGNNPVAIPFEYQAVAGANDVPADAVSATTAGFTTTAGSNHLYLLWVDSQKLPSGKSWARIKSVEVANDPVLGGIILVPNKARYGRHVPNTVIA